ncbi:MAG: hypothetical protein M1121_06010 [Actinobacteria bacterium]|jgi:hypothetical protein|nr:hypothetical protein [Actinomycetota bacterium]
MTIARSVADVLSDHVTLEIECIDRMYLNLYVPRLQYDTGVVGFFCNHLGYTFASSALMDPITKGFVKDIERFCEDQGVDLITFEKGQRKDDIAHEYLDRFDGDEGVLFVGKAQEKTTTFRTEKRINPVTGKPYPWIVRATAMVNQYYFYCLDRDFGPFFIKFSSYFPYNAKLCINGNEWAKCQAAHAGIDFEPLDNGFSFCEEPARLQAICNRLSANKINALTRKWFALLPHPFTGKDRRAGYRYDISILQAEFSLTQVLDRPLTGRVFFEEVIRDNLDLGRPDQVSLIFNRRVTKRTPGRFRTRVVTVGVTPSIHVDYKNTRIKQYHKEGQALRTETTINNTRDFDIGRRLHNLPALRGIGFMANRRLLDVQRKSSDCYIGQDAFAQVCAPVMVQDQRGPAMRFGDPRVQALLSVLVVFRLLPNGFSNKDLREHLAPLLGLDPSAMTAGKMTYDLRRLRLHGIIERVEHTNRYHVTQFGLQVAMFFTRSYNRLLRTGLSEICDPVLIDTPLRCHFDRLQGAIADLITEVGLAA